MPVTLSTFLFVILCFGILISPIPTEAREETKIQAVLDFYCAKALRAYQSLIRHKYYGLEPYQAHLETWNEAIREMVVLGDLLGRKLYEYTLRLIEEDFGSRIDSTALERYIGKLDRDPLKFSFMDYIKSFSGVEGLTPVQKEKIEASSRYRLFRWEGYIADIPESGLGSFMISPEAPLIIASALVEFKLEEGEKLLKYNRGDKVTLEGRFLGVVIVPFKEAFKGWSAMVGMDKLTTQTQYLAFTHEQLVKRGHPLEKQLANVISNPKFEYAVHLLFVNGRLVEDKPKSLHNPK